MPRNGAWRSLVSALVWGTRGPEFKSRRPDSEPHGYRDRAAGAAIPVPNQCPNVPPRCPRWAFTNASGAVRAPNALRHTFASFQIAAGTSVYEIARLMGTK